MILVVLSGENEVDEEYDAVLPSGGVGVEGLLSESEGPEPRRSRVEKTLSYAASRVLVDWPVAWG